VCAAIASWDLRATLDGMTSPDADPGAREESDRVDDGFVA
jgi:hypothetical protein